LRDPDSPSRLLDGQRTQASVVGMGPVGGTTAQPEPTRLIGFDRGMWEPTRFHRHSGHIGATSLSSSHDCPDAVVGLARDPHHFLDGICHDFNGAGSLQRFATHQSLQPSQV
jgi:hypothetical protein